MMTEVLWPKTVKHYISQFRANGTLNPAAIFLLEKHYLSTSITISLLALILYFVGESIPAFLLAIFLPIGSWLELRILFNRNLRAYAEGEKRPVKVLRAFIGRYGAQRIAYEELDGSGHGRIEIPGTPFIELPDTPIIKKESLPKVGDVISIYQDVHRRYMAMPDFLHLKKAYSLSTAII